MQSNLVSTVRQCIALMRRNPNLLVCRIYNRFRFGSVKRLLRTRANLASHYIQGAGIEIGALDHPLDVPAAVNVRYVDRFSTSDLKQQYSEIDPESIVAVDIVEDGETLASIPDATQDFVIANHLLEHCQNPIATIGNWLRVLRLDGVLFLSVPDKRYTFDRWRPLTALDHLYRDWHDGPGLSRRQHYEEWARLVERVPEKQVANRVQVLTQSDYSIHFHVWSEDAFRNFLEFCRRNLNIEFTVWLFMRNGIEVIAILKRLG